VPHKTKSGRYSQSWKDAERLAAKVLRGKRISRGADFSREDVDVEIPDLPELRVDSKYKVRHAHHTLMQGIIDKYVKEDGQEPVLVTRTHRQQGAYVTVRLEFLGFLLDVLRAYAQESP
jgi:hypothetical protein